MLNQNLNKADFAQMEAAHGDAVVTFPYSCDVSENDMLTVLAGTITQKSMVVHTKEDYDVLPAFFVESIVKIIGKEKEFENGVDYVLIGTNDIKCKGRVFGYIQDLSYIHGREEHSSVEEQRISAISEESNRTTVLQL